MRPRVTRPLVSWSRADFTCFPAVSVTTATTADLLPDVPYTKQSVCARVNARRVRPTHVGLFASRTIQKPTRDDPREPSGYGADETYPRRDRERPGLATWCRVKQTPAAPVVAPQPSSSSCSRRRRRIRARMTVPFFTAGRRPCPQTCTRVCIRRV